MNDDPGVGTETEVEVDVEGSTPMAVRGGIEFAGNRWIYVAGAAFWGWLLVRWFYDWVVNPGVGVSARGPFFPPGPFEAAAVALRSIAVPRPIDGFLAWLAGGFDFIAFGLTTLPQLAAGAWLTVVLTVVSILAGLVLAVPLSVARVYGGRVLSGLALGFTELIRGTPLLAQLFVLYFGIGLTRYIREVPGVGVDPIPDQAVVVALVGFTINSAAYQSEYIRSALLSVASGQLTAARAIGLSKLDGIRYVVLPQGLRYAIPGWSNELVYLVKYSSLAAFVTVPELFFRAESIGSETFRYVEVYTLAALFYIAVVLTASAFMDRFEERVSIPGLGTRASR